MKSLLTTIIASLIAIGTAGAGLAADGSGRDHHAADKAGSKLLVGYEGARKALAADDLDAAKTAAGVLAKESKKGGKDTHGHHAIGAAAVKLAEAPDLAGARMAFGELSKAVISLLVKNPDMAKGATAYQCPMAKGYKKWIQRDEDMANPYMGSKMLKCGSKTDLEV